MVTRLNCGDHFIMYVNTKLLCCVPETNTVLYIGYFSTKEFQKKIFKEHIYGTEKNKIPTSNISWGKRTWEMKHFKVD